MKAHKTALLGVGAAVACGLVIFGALLRLRAASSAFVTTRPTAQLPAQAPAPSDHKLTTAAAASAGDAGTHSVQTSAARVSLGRAIFFDTRLSVPEGTSCASCHDAKRAFAGNHGSTNG